MPDTKRRHESHDLAETAKIMDTIRTRIHGMESHDAPQILNERVDALRASLKTMIDHANMALEASQRLRSVDDCLHRSHIQQIETADMTMNDTADEHATYARTRARARTKPAA